MRVAVIIVNFRTTDLVCDCLQSLYAEKESLPMQVVVVDNDSQDGSVEHLSAIVVEQDWQQWVIVLPQEYNLGFAGGNNAAIHYLFRQDVPPDAVLLLNPDTVVHKDAVHNLVHFIEKHPRAGIVGAQLEDEYHVLQSSARRYPSVWSEFDAGARFSWLSSLLKNRLVAMPLQEIPHRCDWVSGAAMLVRRQVFEEIGLMDENFFLYFEELDFCQRTNSASWEIWLEPSARITHLEGRATGIQQSQRRRGLYWYDSRRRYFIKHHGLVRWILADLFWGLGRLSLLCRTRVNLGGDISNDPLCFFRDLMLGDLRALITGEALRIRQG